MWLVWVVLTPIASEMRPLDAWLLGVIATNAHGKLSESRLVVQQRRTEIEHCTRKGSGDTGWRTDESIIECNGKKTSKGKPVQPASVIVQMVKRMP